MSTSLLLCCLYGTHFKQDCYAPPSPFDFATTPDYGFDFDFGNLSRIPTPGVGFDDLPPPTPNPLSNSVLHRATTSSSVLTCFPFSGSSAESSQCPPCSPTCIVRETRSGLGKHWV